MAQLTVKPEDLRFTQNSIAIKFRSPYDDLRIDDAVEQIQEGILTAEEFTTMNVVKRNGILWCLDNRRLWVFRKAQVQQVTVDIVSADYSERSQMFFASLNAELERQYSSSHFYPRVRGKLRYNTNLRVSSKIYSKGSSWNHAAPLYTASSSSSSDVPADTRQASYPSWTHFASSSSIDSRESEPVLARTRDPNAATNADSQMSTLVRYLRDHCSCQCEYDEE